MPAVSIFVTDAPVMLAYTTNQMLGGIIAPIAPAPAISEAA